MNPLRFNMTRRNFLKMVGIAGGSAAVYESMIALDLLRKPAQAASPPNLPFQSGKDKSVVILGAGVAGLCAAYELLKAGYNCTILEAQNRVGGRSYTVRKGDKIPQIGLPEQLCNFDDGLYLNAGPGRLPHHHETIIGYCKELKVPLEVYVMESRAAFFNDEEFDYQSVERRRIANDTRGYVSELLAKCVLPGQLDLGLTRDDEEKLLSMLKEFGALNDLFEYRGSSRAGYKVLPGAGVQPGDEIEPLPLLNLLNSHFWETGFYQPVDYEWQPTMFQPVGGMDKIVDGFHTAVEELNGIIKINVPVTDISKTESGIEVTYKNADTGEESLLSADYCISTIPMPVLADIPNNFSREFQIAIASRPFDATCKVGWQADTRFWEYPHGMNYGGITFTDMEITQIWYPSYDFFTENGTLTGCYNYDDEARVLGNMDLQMRLDFAYDQATRIHPEFPEYVRKELGLSIAWHMVPYQMGGWMKDWHPNEDQETYRRLLEPEGNLYLCGDQLSYLSGWQEGAVLSAQNVVAAIGEHAGA